MSCTGNHNPVEITVGEGGTGTVETVLTDAAGDDVPVSSVGSLVVTLIDERSGDVINSRSAQSVLNANQGTLVDGLFTWEFIAADTPIVGDDIDEGDYESHLATFTMVWDSGAQQMSWLVRMKVVNLRSVS